VTVARRYRWALRAYPPSYRKERGWELLSTLADGDDDRGGPSTREASALAYRGLLERGRIATSGDGLLVIAAAAVVFTVVAGLTWAERLFLYNGQVAASGTDGPGTWSGIALTISAFAILAAGPFHAVDSTRRRRTAACVSFFSALLVWSAPFAIFKYLVPDGGELIEYLGTNFGGIYANWSITVPFAASVSAGTWLALHLLSRVRPRVRRDALAAGLVAAGAVAVTLTWTRPDLVAPYGRSAFADLGAAVFVTALGMLLAAVAALRPVGGYPPPPPGAPGPR
jgi:hypothetical protein